MKVSMSAEDDDLIVFQSCMVQSFARLGQWDMFNINYLSPKALKYYERQEGPYRSNSRQI